MYVCVCMYMYVQETWWRARVGGAREEQYVLPMNGITEIRGNGKKRKMQEVLVVHVTNRCPFID